MTDKVPITVIIPVKNEEKNLPECLARLHKFSEVIIVDSGSTDDTLAIAAKSGATIVNFNWNGKFPKKRNWTLRNIDILNDWVLFIDADEFVDDAFVSEIAHKIVNTSHSGFWLFYDNHFMNKRLKYGDRMNKLALFRKSKGEYEKIDEDYWSSLDMEIHEHPVLEGSTGEISTLVTHKDFKSLEHYINKHNAYSSWEASRYLDLKKSGWEGLNRRQIIKYKLVTLGILPSVYFLYSFIFKLGMLDGYTGYLFAKYKSNYFFQVQTKIIENKNI